MLIFSKEKELELSDAIGFTFSVFSMIRRKDIMVDYVKMTIKEQKNIALIAHDGKKEEMIKWLRKVFTTKKENALELRF